MRARHVFLSFAIMLVVIGSAAVASEPASPAVRPEAQAAGAPTSAPDAAVRKAVLEEGATFTIEDGVIKLDDGTTVARDQKLDDGQQTEVARYRLHGLCRVWFCLYVDVKCFWVSGNGCPNCHYGNCVEEECSGPFQPCP